MYFKTINKDLCVAVLLFCCKLTFCSKLESIWTPHVDCSATSQNPCVLLPTICQPGGKCVAQGCSYKCVCEGGHEGSNCQSESLPSPSKPVNPPTVNGETQPKRLDIFVGNGALNFLDSLLKNTTPEVTTSETVVTTQTTETISLTTTKSSVGDVQSTTTNTTSGSFPFMNLVQAQVQHENDSLSQKANATTGSNKTEIISTAMEHTTDTYTSNSPTIQELNTTSTSTPTNVQDPKLTTTMPNITTTDVSITSTEITKLNVLTVASTVSTFPNDSITEETSVMTTSSGTSTTTLPTTTTTFTSLPVIVSKEPLASSSSAEVKVAPTEPPTTTESVNDTYSNSTESNTSTLSENNTLSSTISTKAVSTTVTETPPSTTTQDITSMSETTTFAFSQTTKSETAVIDELLSALTTLTGVTSLISGQPESPSSMTPKPSEQGRLHSSSSQVTIVSAAAPTNHKNSKTRAKISTKNIDTDQKLLQDSKQISFQDSSTSTLNIKLPESTTSSDSTEKAKRKSQSIRKALKKGKNKERKTIFKQFEPLSDQLVSDNALSLARLDSSRKEPSTKRTLKENMKTTFVSSIDSSTTESSSQETGVPRSTESIVTASDESRSQESIVDSSTEPLILTTTLTSQDRETISSSSIESSDLSTTTDSQSFEATDAQSRETIGASSIQMKTTYSRSKEIVVTTTSDVQNQSKDKDEKSDNHSAEDTGDDKVSQSSENPTAATTAQVTLDINSDTDDYQHESSVTPSVYTKFSPSDDDNAASSVHVRSSPKTPTFTTSPQHNDDKKKVRRSTREFLKELLRGHFVKEIARLVT